MRSTPYAMRESESEGSKPCSLGFRVLNPEANTQNSQNLNPYNNYYTIDA